jgi:hypothetical protein
MHPSQGWLEPEDHFHATFSVNGSEKNSVLKLRYCPVIRKAMLVLTGQFRAQQSVRRG